MRHFGYVVLLLWIFSSPAFSSPGDGADKGNQLLWQIGEFDDNNSEFSLAPDRFSQYDQPGIHVVGLTNPAENWPYILPGKLDTWAGSGPQTFEIFFYLDRVVSQGECSLLLDFLDTHSYAPPRLVVKVNNQAQEQQTERGNNDWLMAARDGSGRESIATFQLPATLLKKGENRIEVTASEGSWVLWDAISLEVPAGVKAGNPDERTTLRSVVQKQVLVSRDGRLFKPLELEILHIGKTTGAVIKIGGGVDPGN